MEAKSSMAGAWSPPLVPAWIRRSQVWNPWEGNKLSFTTPVWTWYPTKFPANPPYSSNDPQALSHGLCCHHLLNSLHYTMTLTSEQACTCTLLGGLLLSLRMDTCLHITGSYKGLFWFAVFLGVVPEPEHLRALRALSITKNIKLGASV